MYLLEHITAIQHRNFKIWFARDVFWQQYESVIVANFKACGNKCYSRPTSEGANLGGGSEGKCLHHNFGVIASDKIDLSCLLYSFRKKYTIAAL